MTEGQQLGLIGGDSIARYSVAHLVWREIINAANVNAQFDYHPVIGAKQLSEKLELVRSGEIAGTNVALPWKKIAAAQSDICTEVVAATGYANTIFGRDGMLYADNTDGRGFLKGLNAMLIGKAMIYGAGGAGTVLAYELIMAGVQVTIADTEEVALYEVKQLTKGWDAYARIKIEHVLDVVPSDFDLVVNATPLGRGLPSGNIAQYNTKYSPMSDKFAQQVRGVATFAEMNYYPAVSKFIAQANAAHQRTIPGLVMLLNQAVLSYEDYSGTLLDNNQIGSIKLRLQKVLFDSQ
jgi:shikimate dehydrogenase